MKTIYYHHGLDPLPSEGPIVMAIGYFDGVHLGHREVIQTAKEEARRLGIPCGVMTFDPHPREVLGREQRREYLTPLEEKLKQLEEMGIDAVWVLHFDIPFSQLTPEAFISTVLFPLDVKSVVVGFDFTFGHKGKGTSQLLKKWGEGQFNVLVIPPIKIHGEKVSSTYIRELLHQGRPQEVEALLGRPFSLQGWVVHGEGRGRTIGFPTANVEVDAPYLLPKHGVYAVRARWADQARYGVMNIGLKPTFRDDLQKPTVEIHLFDTEADLYGKRMTVECLSYLRSEKKFSSVEALIQQIHTDAEQAKRFFAER
jgi:riboflavin kinase/FMN adenylyltransferase